MRTVSLLIVEKGACWIERALAWRTPANEMLALIQDREESDHEFRSRVEQRLQRLRDKRVWPEQIFLLVRARCNSRPDSSRMLRSIVGTWGTSPTPARVILVPSAPDRMVDLPWESLSRMHTGPIQEPRSLDMSPTQNAPA